MTQAQFIREVRAAAAEVPGVNPEAAAAHAANESQKFVTALSPLSRRAASS